MSALSALRIHDRVCLRDPNIEPVPPFYADRPRPVGAVVDNDPNVEGGPWVVLFRSIRNGEPVATIACSADQLRRMPTPGDTIEMASNAGGVASGRITGVHISPRTGGDISYSVRMAVHGRPLTARLYPGEFRVVREWHADVPPRRGKRWRGFDETYRLATFRDKRTRVVLSVEWKPADLWVGLFTAPKGGRRHVWLAFLTLVLHVWRERHAELPSTPA